jgi:hypothetical protein
VLYVMYPSRTCELLSLRKKQATLSYLRCQSIESVSVEKAVDDVCIAERAYDQADRARSRLTVRVRQRADRHPAKLTVVFARRGRLLGDGGGGS